MKLRVPALGSSQLGVELLGQSAIIAPSGQIVAQCVTNGDEVATARIDLDYTRFYKDTLADFDRYRMPEHYKLITETSNGTPKEPT